MAYTQSPPLQEKAWLTAEEISSGGRARGLDARSDPRVGMRATKASTPSPHSFGRKGDQMASVRPSIGRRILRTLTRFFLVALIGVGATLGWQSYGDTAREMVAARVPALAGLLSISATKSPVVAATAPASVQQLQSLASNLDIVRRNVEQLAVRQDQMAQNIATLQAVEEDIRRKISYTPTFQQAVSLPEQKLSQPRAQPSSLSRSQPPTGPLLLSR